MSGSGRVLFLGHEASRTGAPRLLLEFLKWLPGKSSLRPVVLLKRPGVLEAEYRAGVPEVLSYRDWLPATSRAFRWRLLRRLGWTRFLGPDLNRRFPVEDYPVVYANTIDSLDLARDLAVPGRRCLLHVHELRYAVWLHQVEAALRRSVDFVTTYVAASEAVRAYLEGELGIPDARIRVVHEFPVAYMKGDAMLAAARREVRSELGVEEGTPIIGMCGTLDWRKGVDLFVQLALRLRAELGGPFLCVWVGGDPASVTVRHDLASAGLEPFVRIVPPNDRPERFYPAFDVFALTSREDPFPVAMLEAAASGVPVVAFQGSGGAAEFLANESGRLAAYLDVNDLARVVIRLLQDDALRLTAGRRDRAAALELYPLERQGAKLLSLLEQLYGGGGP